MMLEMKSEKEERVVSLEISDPKDLRPIINALPDGVVISLDMEEVIADELATYDREVFAVLNLKSNGQAINLNICSMGTLDSSMVSPREVFKSSILSNAAAFIAIHNHPSGSLSPSPEDKDVTKRLLACSELLGIKMLDHIIVAGDKAEMYSFKQDGMLDHLRPSREVWER